ncbi:MAG: hypothetical protein AB1689_29465 [Thermodesulfobacteriota bacterium]
MLLVACWPWAFAASFAADLTDPFTTTPFSELPSLRRWCERWHHLHWDSVDDRLETRRTFDLQCNDGVSNQTGRPCCSNCPSCSFSACPNGCSNDNPIVGADGLEAHFVISHQEHAGELRHGEVDFVLAEHFTSGGHHPTIFPVTHPACHTGVQGTLFRNIADGRYVIGLLAGGDEENFPGYNECVAGSGPGIEFSDPATWDTLTVGQRYRMVVDVGTVRNLGGGSFDGLLARMVLYDQAGQELQSKLIRSATIPVWYDSEAQRFGFGGGFDPTISYAFDNFEGDAQDKPGCGDLNASNTISTADVVLLFRAVLENPDPSPLCGGAGALACGDIVSNGSINTNDVVILFSAVLGNAVAPLCAPPPSP